MKALGICGSPRKDSNTGAMIKKVFGPLEDAGVKTELYQAGGLPLLGCKACMWCAHHPEAKRCVQDTDAMNEIIAKMLEADCIILGSPVYFSDITPEIKAIIDRAGFVSMVSGSLLKRKLGAAVLAVRRAGAVHAFNSINHFFLINQMIIPGSSYWNMAYGLKPGDCLEDEEGVRTMETLGENMVWLLSKINEQK